jgi:glycosyltransferase involved in cell wall biosynthesis
LWQSLETRPLEKLRVLAPAISVIITSHNEGAELKRTLRSVLDNTRNLAEVIVVDEASTDDSCRDIAGDRVRVIRHEARIGVAFSRNEASRAAQGDVLCYLDAHQRVSRGCLDRCASLAQESQAITCPDIRDYGLLCWRQYGVDFCLHPKRGYFTGKWRIWRLRRGVSTATALRAPPYLIPRSLYPKIAWSESLRGWGATEASVGVKSFFSGTRILHLGGPVARHLFRDSFHYETTWDGIWRNHAIIARICFDDATWFHYWLPQVFEQHLSAEARQALESPEVRADHEAFLATKVRTDRQFWTELVRKSPPPGI